MVGFLMIASTAGSMALICWGPIFIHAALICSDIANDQSNVTGVFVTLIGMV